MWQPDIRRRWERVSKSMIRRCVETEARADENTSKEWPIQLCCTAAASFKVNDRQLFQFEHAVTLSNQFSLQLTHLKERCWQCWVLDALLSIWIIPSFSSRIFFLFQEILNLFSFRIYGPSLNFLILKCISTNQISVKRWIFSYAGICRLTRRIFRFSHYRILSLPLLPVMSQAS